MNTLQVYDHIMNVRFTVAFSRHAKWVLSLCGHSGTFVLATYPFGRHGARRFRILYLTLTLCSPFARLVLGRLFVLLRLCRSPCSLSRILLRPSSLSILFLVGLVGLDQLPNVAESIQTPVELNKDWEAIIDPKF